MNNFKKFLELEEAPLTLVLEIEVDLGVSFEKTALKRTPSEELKSEWDLYRREIRRVVKPLGGLITDTKSPSNKAAPNGKRIGTVTVGTRGDASKLDPAKIKAALSKNVEVSDMTITRLDESLKACMEDVELNEMTQRFAFDNLKKATAAEKLADKYNLSVDSGVEGKIYYVAVTGKFTDITKWMKELD